MFDVDLLIGVPLLNHSPSSDKVGQLVVLGRRKPQVHSERVSTNDLDHGFLFSTPPLVESQLQCLKTRRPTSTLVCCL